MRIRRGAFKQLKNNHVTTNLDPETTEMLDFEAQKRDLARGIMARQIIKEWLNGKGWPNSEKEQPNHEKPKTVVYYLDRLEEIIGCPVDIHFNKNREASKEEE